MTTFNLANVANSDIDNLSLGDIKTHKLGVSGYNLSKDIRTTVKKGEVLKVDMARVFLNTLVQVKNNNLNYINELFQALDATYKKEFNIWLKELEIKPMLRRESIKDGGKIKFIKGASKNFDALNAFIAEKLGNSTLVEKKGFYFPKFSCFCFSNNDKKEVSFNEFDLTWQMALLIKKAKANGIEEVNSLINKAMLVSKGTKKEAQEALNA